MTMSSTVQQTLKHPSCPDDSFLRCGSVFICAMLLQAALIVHCLKLFFFVTSCSSDTSSFGFDQEQSLRMFTDQAFRITGWRKTGFGLKGGTPIVRKNTSEKAMNENQMAESSLHIACKDGENSKSTSATKQRFKLLFKLFLTLTFIFLKLRDLC